MNKTIEIPEGCVARIKGNKVIIEPKDSEDEKIRKSIIHLLQVGGYMSPADKTKAFAWLEKQKEQNVPGYKTDDYFCEKCQENAFNAGKEAGLKEQKPAEWSEEDEEMIDYIIHALSNNTCVKEEGPAIYTKEINWLKSLYPQPKQEWSKEDKDKIESIKVLITTGKFVDINTIKTIWKLLDSLRPQPNWKPSKEQMDALDSAINYLTEHTCTPGNPLLISLYHGLQKLL